MDADYAAAAIDRCDGIRRRSRGRCLRQFRCEESSRCADCFPARTRTGTFAHIGYGS